MNIKELIKNNSTVHFSYFRNGIFYYEIGGSIIPSNEDEFLGYSDKYQFMVPLDDINGATINSVEKSIYFLRWIKRAIKDNTLVKVS